MRIKYVDITNFRKLQSVRLELDDKSTILVGANNSGKTSAMTALGLFLISPDTLKLRDVTISNWKKINAIGQFWENEQLDTTDKLAPYNLNDLLPAMDVWLDVPIDQIRYVADILPDLDWKEGLLGVRLKYQVKDFQKLRQEYQIERSAAKNINKKSQEAKTKSKTKDGKRATEVVVWPRNLTDFLESRLRTYIELKPYPLDPSKFDKDGKSPQKLSEEIQPFERSPLQNIIKIYEIAAQRDFADATVNDGKKDDKGAGAGKFKRRLSDQLRKYYEQHVDPTKTPTDADLSALTAIQTAEREFGGLLEKGLEVPLSELKGIGYPGITDPQLVITPHLTTTDILNYPSSVSYKVMDPETNSNDELVLPENYCGLGYQNLISMVFMMMGFRDDWMRVGKADTSVPEYKKEILIEPIQLVLIEEPEAHLHAQVQQVFIRKAYDLLRKHSSLGDSEEFVTQLVVSTHSPHITHEVSFSSLRYFRRYPAINKDETPTTRIINLSNIFDKKSDEIRFVERYLKIMHCDLFFADGVIFVEGAAERILVPYLIQNHFKNILRRYISLLEVGGNYIHKFRPLLEELGLATLIITDLDSVAKNNEENNRLTSVMPEKGKGQQTSNPTIKEWFSKASSTKVVLIDDLLNVDLNDYFKNPIHGLSLYIAFQQKINVNELGDFIPRTFEDAVIYQNIEIAKDLNGEAGKIVKNFNENNQDIKTLSNNIFEWVRRTDKVNFALDCLMYKDGGKLKVPFYIDSGLKWFQEKLQADPDEKGGHVDVRY